MIEILNINEDIVVINKDGNNIVTTRDGRTDQELIDSIVDIPMEEIGEGFTLEQAVEKILTSDLSKLDATTKEALDTKLSITTPIVEENK